MTEIKNETGTKKKLLIPVVVLMLLAVGLTGAAYAYSSTLTVGNNGVDAEYLSVDLNTPTAPGTSISLSQKPIATFTDNFEYVESGDPATWTKTNTIKYEQTNPDIALYAIKVSANAEWNKITVSSTATLDSELTRLFDIKYKVMSLDGQTQIIGETALGATVDKATMQNDTAYTVQLLAVKKIASGIVEEVDPVTAGAHDAAWYSNHIDAITFGIVIEASYVAPSP